MNEKSEVTYGSIKTADPKVINDIFNKFSFNPNWMKPDECASIVPQGIRLA
jgi:hypothetical protein